jgi:hypothetical protein
VVAEEGKVVRLDAERVRVSERTVRWKRGEGASGWRGLAIGHLVPLGLD